MNIKIIKKIGFSFILLMLLGVKLAYSGIFCGSSFNGPDSDFSVDKTMPVVGEIVEFTNTTDNGDGDDDDYTWTWNFGAGANPGTAITTIRAASPAATYATTGEKTVTLTTTWEIKGGGTDTETKNNYINVGAAPTPGSIGGSQSICSGDTPAELTSTAAGGGSVNTYIVYQWEANAGGSWVTISGATGDTYQPPLDLNATTCYRRRTVTDWGNITRYSGYTGEVTVTVNELPVFSTEKTDVKCFGGNDGCITVTATGGSGSYFYSKDNGATYTSPAKSEFHSFENLSTGDFFIRVRDTNGCVTPPYE